ncbi:TPA: hypothetical protein L9A83_005029 [Klebsiella pneumoniae]|nr:hypothetical protein [Klebsiella pneumoniae]
METPDDMLLPDPFIDYPDPRPEIAVLSADLSADSLDHHDSGVDYTRVYLAQLNSRRTLRPPPYREPPMPKAKSYKLSPLHTDRLTQTTLCIAFRLRTEVRPRDVLHALIDQLCEGDDSTVETLGLLIQKNQQRERNRDRRRRQKQLMASQ